MAVSIASAYARQFDELLAAYSTEVEKAITVAGVDFPCIAPPVERMKSLTQGPYDADRTVTFQVKKSDFQSSGLKERDPFTFDTVKFEVKTIRTDPLKAHVEIFAKLRQ